MTDRPKRGPGRPPRSREPADMKLDCRCTLAEYQEVLRAAIAHRMSISAYLRGAPAREAELLRRLRRLSRP